MNDFINKQFGIMKNKLDWFKKNEIDLYVLVADLCTLKDALSPCLNDTQWEDHIVKLFGDCERYFTDENVKIKKIYYKDLPVELSDKYLN